MADERIKIILDAGMDISDVQANAKQIQNILKGFKMPAALSEDFEKQFKVLETEITKIQAQMKAGFKTKGDITGLEKSTKTINTVFGTLKNLYSTFENEHLMMNVDFNTDEIKQARKDLTDLQQQLKSKINTTEFTNLGEKIKEIDTLSKSGAVKNLKESFSSLDLSGVRSDLDSVVGGLTNFAKGNKDAVAAAKLFQDAWSSGKLDDIDDILEEMTPNMQKVALAARDARNDLDALGNSDIGKLSNKIQKTTQHVKELENTQVDKVTQNTRELGQAFDQAGDHAEKCGNSIKGVANDMYSFNGQIEQVKNRVKDFFSLTNSVMLFRRGVQKAFEVVKELDAAMTETAVVTDFSVGDMWDQLPRYTAAANELGTTTLGAYETMTLFYQQGLETNEVFEIGTETMKMARIAGLDYADATDLMTAALRGFNMELNEASATRINDVYSELAAITAADTSEIANAMTKTASIAANANMEFETTAALLSQIIETTREPAETAGTAMKTIIARFTEMKKATSDLINVDGEEVSVNKVEDALKSAGVALRDVNGEFRDLDDVFLELSSKWNGLDKMTQRYVATMAAGSRQQSRFIAMMSDYDRTIELVNAAYSSSGASQGQFEKTQDSLESKLNKLKNAWNEFLMGISNSKVIKAGVDALTKLLNIINKLTGNSGIAKLLVAITGLKGGKAIFEGLFRSFAPFGNKMEKAGAEVGGGLLRGLTQRINNFNKGKGFFLDVDVNTKGIKNKFDQITNDWTGLKKVMSQQWIPSGTIIGFEALDKQLVITSITAEGATESIELGLSEVGTKAILTAATADGMGDELVESGLEGTFAMKVLEEQIEALNKDLALAKWLGDDVGAANIQVDIDNYTRDLNKLQKGNNAALSKGTKNMFGKSIKDSFKGLIKGAKGFFSALAPIAPLIAILVAEIGLLAAAWYFSPEQTLKRQIEDATAAAKSANEVFNNVNASLDELTGYRTDLEAIQDGFEGLAEGTSEWRAQLAKANALVLEIIRKYPDLAQYQTYGENGQLDLTEEGWDKVIQKQTESAAIASTTNTVAAARVDQLNSELTMYQNLEDKQDELAGGWDEGLGWGVGTVGGIAGGAIGVSATTAGMLVGLWSGAISGSVVPVVGTIIGGLIGVIAGAAAGYATSKAVQDSTEDSEEYQEYKRELEEKQKIERESRLQQYSAALYNQFSTDEEMAEDQNLGVATELMAERIDTNLASISSEMGLDDWTTDGANKDEILEWAENLGYTVKNDKVYDQSGELVFKIEKSGDAHEGEEGWITNEQIAQQLAVQRATNATEDTKELLDLMSKTEGKLGLEAGGFNSLFFEDGDLSGSEVRKLMGVGLSEVSAELNQMQALTGQDISVLMSNKKAKAELYYKQMNQEMAIFSGMFAGEVDYAKYQEDFSTWADSLSDEQYANMLDSYKSIKDTMGGAAAGFYVDTLKDNAQDIEKFQNVFNNIDFSNPISAYADLKKASEETTGAIKDTVDSMLEMGETQGKINKSSQWKFFFNSEEFTEIRGKLDEIVSSGKEITADNIYELAESSSYLRQMLNSGAAGAESLRIAIEALGEGTLSTTDLTENFVKALSELHSLADMTAEAFHDIDNFNLSRSSTEIGEFYATTEKEMLELYNKGAYGDQRLISYAKSIVGAEEWETILNKSTDGYRGALKEVFRRINGDSASMYSDWMKASKKLDFVSTDKSGNILFDFNRLQQEFSSSDEIITHIAEQLKLSEDYVKAMIVDMSTFSSEFGEVWKDFSQENALNILISEAPLYTVDGKKKISLSREQLDQFVDDVDGFIKHFETETEMEIEVKPLIDGEVWSEDLIKVTTQYLNQLNDANDNELFTQTNNLLKFKDDKSRHAAMTGMYQMYIDLGFDEQEAQGMVQDALNGKVYTVDLDKDGTADQVTDSMVSGLTNYGIVLASIETAKAVGEVYYQYIYAAIVNAMQLAAYQTPGQEQFTVTGKGGEKSGYTSDEQVSFTTNMTRDEIEASRVFNGYYITEEQKKSSGGYQAGATDWAVDQTTGKIKYRHYVQTSNYGGQRKWVTTDVSANKDYEYAVTGTIDGKETTIYLEDLSGFKSDTNSNTPVFDTTAPEFTAQITTSLEKQIYEEATGLDAAAATAEEIEAAVKTYVAENPNANLVKSYTALGSRSPLSTGSGSGSDGYGDFEQESDRIKKKIDEIDSAIKDLADNDIADMAKINELIEQKIALQKEYKKALEKELIMLSASTDEIWSQVKKEGNDKYIEYSDETGGYQYTDAYYDDFFKNGIPIDSEQMQKVQEQMNQLNQANSDQLSNQIAIKELVDNLVQNQAENYNAERSLKGRERRQTEADAEEDLIGMLPEEIQPFFQALNTAEDARLEMQEIQANKVLAENLQQQLNASYAGVPDYIKENMTFDEYSGYGIDLAKINQIEDKEAREEMLTAVQENAKILNEQYFDPLYDVKEQLSGGKLQKGILTTAKALKDFAKEVSDNDFNDGLLKVETGFKALDEALNGLIERIENSELVDEFLNKKAIGGLGLGDKERDALLSNEKLVEFLGKSGLGPIVSEIGWGEGATNGELLSLANGFMGGALEQIGGFLNFDMMKILGDSGGLIEQGKQMVEQIVGKVAEITGALIDAWTNREDILYNFLNVLERYLHDYEVMQRYSTQLEKGRMASVDDIRQNWEQQWQSLQDQLEMQQERIETRQDQLDRSRWNPFQLISGWNPETDSLYENRGIKMAFDLLISAIGMLPMGLGAFGGQLNQLYEDYDKRVQEAYEDRLAAEMAILDIEDERLELVKIGAEEATEFEQKVLDALIQKEQEQIEELSRLNDAITDANSKLISTLQKNLDQIRQDRENEKKEEELGEKERRLAYLRQDTSGANMMEIKKLEEELEEGHEDYTDTLIDQKISELEKQNEAAAEQRQQQIDLLQAQLDWSQKYGLYWDAIYGMLYTIDENGNAVLNPENFDLDGNIRENSQLAQMLGTFSDRLGMSVWSSVLDNEEAKRLGRYYGAFIGNNGVAGEWADYWALLNPGADDPDYATPDPDIPEGILGVLWNIESSLRNYFIKSDGALFDGFGHMGEKIANGLGDLLGIDSLSNYDYITNSKRTDQAPLTEMLVNGGEKMAEGWMNILSRGNKTTQGLSRTENNGVETMNIHFNIGNVGENISLDDMVDKVTVAFKEMFTGKTNLLKVGH